MKKHTKTNEKKKQWIAIGCVAIGIFIVVFLCIIFGIGLKKDTQYTPEDEVSSGSESVVMKNEVFNKTYKEFRAIINAELAGKKEYSNFSLSEFKEVGTDEEYKDYEYLRTNLYKATINKNVDVFVLANESSGLISQIRFSTSIKNDAGDTKLMGWLLGCNLRLMYNNVADIAMSEVMDGLGLAYPYEGMDATHTYNKNIYRSRLKDNIWTIYITDTDFDFIEKNKVAIITYEEQAKIDAEEAERKHKAEEQARQELAKKERTFAAGNYKVGSDIDVGTYDMVAISGHGNCFIEDDEGWSVVAETFSSTDGRYSIKEYRNIELSLGYVIQVKSSLRIKFVPVK